MKRVKARPAQVHWRNSGRAQQPSSRNTLPHRKIIYHHQLWGNLVLLINRACHSVAVMPSPLSTVWCLLSPALPLSCCPALWSLPLPLILLIAPVLDRARAHACSLSLSLSPRGVRSARRTDLSVQNGLALTSVQCRLLPIFSFFWRVSSIHAGRRRLGGGPRDQLTRVRGASSQFIHTGLFLLGCGKGTRWSRLIPCEHNQRAALRAAIMLFTYLIARNGGG